MNESLKKEIWSEIEEQVDIIDLVKRKFDERLGDNSYPTDLIVACHNWVNKWLMSKSIHEQRQQKYEVKEGIRKKIILRDGEKKTIDVKDELKADGWLFDGDRKAWYKEMTMTEWNMINGKEPYKYLTASYE